MVVDTGDDGTTRTVCYGYDHEGQLLTVSGDTYPETYAYDALGRATIGHRRRGQQDGVTSTTLSATRREVDYPERRQDAVHARTTWPATCSPAYNGVGVESHVSRTPIPANELTDVKYTPADERLCKGSALGPSHYTYDTLGRLETAQGQRRRLRTY